MPAPPIAIYGAIARFNYGDLIFPLVLQRLLDDAGCDRPLVAVGLREGDLSQFDAMPTRAASWLAKPENLPDGSRIIIAGGEALAAGWGRMASHLLPQKIGDPLYALAARLLSERTLDRIGQRRIGTSWPRPFCPRSEHFQNDVDVLFNAVGGSGIPRLSEELQEEIRHSVRAAHYASVRDRATYDALGGESSGAELHPDSAAVMPDLFPPEWLRDKARPDARSILDEGRPFLCFQLHRYFAPEKLAKFAKELDRVHRELGLRIVLLPIGRAAGHSDQVSLERVRAGMACEADMPEDLGVFDIMALLAHSACYTGTSLHGLITAMSYARPYAIIGKNSKCLSFLDEWAPEEMRPIAKASGFCETVGERFATKPDLLVDSASQLRVAARTGLDRLVAAALSA